MIRQYRLEYKDHKDEIRALNKILADLQAVTPIAEELEKTVQSIILRISELMEQQQPQLRDYDPREQFL